MDKHDQRHDIAFVYNKIAAKMIDPPVMMIPLTIRIDGKETSVWTTEANLNDIKGWGIKVVVNK